LTKTARLALVFKQEVVTEEVICPKLQELLFFMHSFLTAKVSFTGLVSQICRL
jgi:hypothetical protein